MVVPYRPAVLAAKMLAAIDVLSGRRLVVGIGAGWLEAEFDAVAVTPFKARAAVTDEYIRAFRTLWTEEDPHHHGDRVNFSDMLFEPKPVQKPHLPIWVGGESRPALRRAASLRDAWYPIGSNNRHLLDTLPRYRAGIARLRRFAEEAGRKPADIALTYSVKVTAMRYRPPRRTASASCFRKRRRHCQRFPCACVISVSPPSTSISSARSSMPRSPKCGCLKRRCWPGYSLSEPRFSRRRFVEG